MFPEYKTTTILMKKLPLSIVLALLCSLFAQLSMASGYTPDPKGGTIAGRVLDVATGKPMEYVNVAVFKAADSSLVTGAVTSPEGEFKVDKLAPGEYYLRLSFLGFEDKFTARFTIGDKSALTHLGNISMSAGAAELSGVAVVADRKKVEYQIDKRVVNVSQDIIAKGGTAVSVLENTPSVQVDPQGNLTLRGSSDYIVLIDGKPSALKGSDALKTINAAAIKQIEVITNPSAKYEADGKAGIINIIQKKEKLQGLSGTANVSLSTREKTSANILLNMRKNKINVFAGLDFARNKYSADIKMNGESTLENGKFFLNETVEQYNHNDNLGGKAGIDYDLNANNTFTLSGNYGKQGYDHGAGATFYNYFEGQDKNYFKSNSDMDVTGNVPGVNLDYTHKFGENHTLLISNSYSAWDGTDNNRVSENLTDENYNQIELLSDLKYTKKNSNYQYRFNADYKKPIGSGTLETGVQYRYENRYDNLDFFNFDTETNLWEVNNTYTYELNYDNYIYSGYATYSDKIWGIGYMLGARTEYFKRSITFSNDDQKYDFDKFMLYPSVHLSKSIKDKHQFQLSYSRRINRPLPWLLNKTPDYIDPYNIFKGSPYLEPEYTDAFELNYRLMLKKVSFNVQTYFRNTTNSFSASRTLQPDGVMIHQLINADNQTAYGVELGMDFTLTKWWQLSTGADLYHFTLDAVAGDNNEARKANTGDFRLISNFTLKWGTRIQAVGYMRGPSVDAQGENDGFYLVNLGVNQSIMKGKLNLGVSAQNILNSIKFDYNASASNYKNTYSIAAEGMMLQLTASYSFNNFQYKQRGRADDASFKGGGAF
jgi:outer membrane receptor protein involved in Fe transport